MHHGEKVFNEIYWATRLASLHETFSGFGILAFLAFFMLGISYFSTSEERSEKKEVKKYWFISLVIFLVCSFACVIFPSYKDLALIYGWEALTSDTAKEVFERVMEKVGI